MENTRRTLRIPRLLDARLKAERANLSVTTGMRVSLNSAFVHVLKRGLDAAAG
jgi:hypothetical protein